MMQPNTGPPGRPTLRLCAGLLALAGLVSLVGVGRASTEKRTSSKAVEAFTKALLLEKSYASGAGLNDEAQKKALDFRRANLKAAADKLTSLSDLAQALLWPSWPFEDTSNYDQKARDIDSDIREDLVKRFVRDLKRGLAGKDDPPRQAAIAILLGETALTSSTDPERRPIDEKAPDKASMKLRSGRATLFRELAALTTELADLTKSNAPQVRGAAARALGQFALKPRAATAALERVLVTDNNYVGNRRAAANSLAALVQTVSAIEPAQSSEPGIMSRETRRSQGLFSAKDQIAVWSSVIPVAARGLSDDDVRVRRSSISAMQQASAALALEIYFQSVFPELKAFPPRPVDQLTTAEKRRIIDEGHLGKGEDRFGYKGLVAIEKELTPAIGALTRTPKAGVSVRDALVRAASDPDVEVRLGVRRTFEEMARAQRFLIDLRKALPSIKELEAAKGKGEEPIDPPKKDDKDKKDDKKDKDKKDKDKGKKKDDIGWRNSRPVLQFVSLRLAQKDEDDKKRDEKLGLPKAAERDDDKDEEDPFKDEKVAPDALAKTLVGIGQDVIRRGAIDPNPAGRRASLEAVEAMGEAGEVFLPQLVAALKDPDRFVRWIASRALGRLAPVGASDAVPGLICLLDEVDLNVRLAAIEALSLYKVAAVDAVPELGERLNKGDAESRIAMMRAIESIGGEKGGRDKAVAALPAFAPLLINLDPRLRSEAARVLGTFGSAAREFLPQLQRLLRDPDSEVRLSASSAIISITGKDAKEK